MTAYLIKSTVSLLLMFGLYWFLLRKEKLFVFNRYFLVVSVVFSLVLPFISIPVNFRVKPQLNEIIPAYNYVTPENSIAVNFVPGDLSISQPSIAKKTSAINTSAILLALYISGVIFFLFRFLRNIYIIIKRSYLSEKISFNGYQIVLTNDTTGPYCFFSNIFLNRNDYLSGKIDKELLDHELEHAMQSHSFDIVLIELVKIFYWFNPVHILYERAIRINHEYLADSGVIADNSDIKSYADKLLGFITVRSKVSLTSGSNNSFTKMRLLMIMKSKSGRVIYRARIAITLCMGTVIFLLLSFKESGLKPSTPNLSETGTEMAQNIVRGIVLMEDGKPLAGATVSTSGPNISPYKTSTDFNGRFSITDLPAGTSLIITYRGFKDQTIKADFTSELVIRLVRDQDYKGKILIPEIQNVNFRNSDFKPANALVVIDGVIIDYKANLKVNPGEIKSFKLLTDKEAGDKYGDKGEDGVVEIILSGKNSAKNLPADSSKYIKYLSINHVTNKGELVDIPVSNLQYVGVWTYHDIDNIDKKELRSIYIMTRDYFKVKGRVVGENGKPFARVKISASDNPETVTSDKEGGFVIKDVREGALLEFSLPGYKTYYLSTLYEVAFNEELTIELKKDGTPEQLFSNTSEISILKFLGMNTRYPQEAKASSDTGRVFVVVKMKKGGIIKECKAYTEKNKINVPVLPEVVIVGYKSSTYPGELRPGKTTGNTTGNNLVSLQTECERVANKLGMIEIPEWKEKNMEFALAITFVLK